jgi:deoxyadenosine/deoxycytidine kinase
MYIVEGNIGAGKSTFLTLIQQALPEYSVALEPIHDWQDQGYGQSLLANFYNNPQRWAYTLETLTLMCRIREQLLEQQLYGSKVRIVERSVYSGHYCFAKNGYEHGFLTEAEWQMYQEWFNFLTLQLQRPQGFIYLQIDPGVAFNRTKKRQRPSEGSLSLDYLEQIHAKHEQFLVAKEGINEHMRNVPVLVLNVNQEFATHEPTLSEHVEALQQFIQQTV